MALLLGGDVAVQEWNGRRARNEKVPRLRGAKLERARLSGFNLSRLDLGGAWLGEADLHAAVLSETRLAGAHLNACNLRGARLLGTNLRGADLQRASVEDANMTAADLSRANLQRAYMRSAILRRADCRSADLRGVDLSRADLRDAKLADADLRGTDFRRANLQGADLGSCKAGRADFSQANLTGANLAEALLDHARLVEADCERACFDGASVYGVSAWNTRLREARQSDLIISARDEARITVDSLDIAQFIHMLLDNERIRHVIDTLTSKIVLILGRFTPLEKAVLDKLRDELRKRNLASVIFDFGQPKSRGITDTVLTLAQLSRFVIADLTNPGMVRTELERIVRNVPVPVKPLIRTGEREPAELDDLRRTHRSLLDTYEYRSPSELLAVLDDQVIKPAIEHSEAFLRPRPPSSDGRKSTLSAF